MKAEIPLEFLKDQAKEKYDSIFGFSDHLTITSYVPKEKKQ